MSFWPSSCHKAGQGENVGPKGKMTSSFFYHEKAQLYEFKKVLALKSTEKGSVYLASR